MLRVGGREGEETITARSFSSFIVSCHLDISYSRGRVSLCSTSPVHPSHCSGTCHILRSILFFLASGFACSIIYIILGYTTLLVWPLRTYSDRESSFLLVVNGVVGWWGGVGVSKCLCSFDFVWRHVLCRTLLALPVP